MEMGVLWKNMSNNAAYGITYLIGTIYALPSTKECEKEKNNFNISLLLQGNNRSVLSDLLK